MNLLTSNLETAPIPVWALLLIMLWVLPWKGYAMWLAVKNNQRNWFIALLILNTLAILDIIYIFFVNKKKK
ncbi:MAG: hypothetical protein KAJ58_00210 [Candidatus Pacebacteria bacterium]|nr:hypothetical protein [Candidatus Paceibacterota bacterium]